jgi:hypothetical protein
MSNKYSVAFTVSHPNADPECISAAIGLSPRRYWRVGDQRVALNGAELDGTYSSTYCVFDLEDCAGRELSDFIGQMIRSLETCTEFIWQLRRTGGRASFYVLWEPGDHRGDTFDVELLSNLARVGIDLDIEPLF